MSANPPKSIKVPERMFRFSQLASTGEGDARTFSMSISSDTPYLRYDWWNDEEFYEVLDHRPQAMKTERLENGLPILWNHDRERVLGKANSYACDGHRCTVADLVWSQSDFAKEKKADIDAGVSDQTSIGYSLIGDGEKIGMKDGIPILRFAFEIHEASVVSVQADPTVGIGRNRSHKPEGEPKEISVKNAIDDTKGNPDNAETTPMKLNPLAATHFRNKDESGGGTAAPVIDAKAERAQAISEFKARCKKIDDHVAAIRSDKWRELVLPVANAHKEGDADYEAFRTAANNAIDAYTSSQAQGRGDAASGIQVIGERPQNPNQRGASIGQAFVDSAQYKELGARTGQRRSISMDVPDCTMLGIRGKAQMAQRAGWTSSDVSAVNIQPIPGIVTLGVQPLTIMDLLAGGQTGAAALPFLKENSLGSVDGVAVAAGASPRAKTVGEGQRKPIYDPDFTTDVANVKKVAAVTKVPDEFIADIPQTMSFINERLPYMVDLETDYQLLYGDGTGNNLKGIFSNTGIQTRTIDTTSDATVAASLKKGLTDIFVGSRFIPTGFGFHPYDWETASLLKDTTGRFLAGGPFYVPYTGGLYQEIYTFWGKPVVVSDSITYGKPVAGAWKLGAQYFMREGMRIEMTNSNEDDFVTNRIAIRAEHRLTVATYRPPAFLEFQGFPART